MIRFRSAKANELIEKAREMPSGVQQIEMYRRASVLADRQGDLAAAFAARDELCQAAYYTEQTLDQLIAFAYCLGASQRHPDQFNQGDLMWRYKWVAGSLKSCIYVPIRLYERLLEEMEVTYRKHGLGTAAVDQLRLSFYINTGQKDRLERAFIAWENNRDRSGSDCAACQQDRRVDYYVEIGDHERAIQEAEPLISKRMRCAEIPHMTFGTLYWPLLHLGRFEAAVDCFVQGYDMVKGREGLTSTVAEHLMFLAVAGQLPAGFQAMQYHLKVGMSLPYEAQLLVFYRGVWALLERAVMEGWGVVTLSLSPRFPLYESDGIYDVPRLRDFFCSQLDDLNTRFDLRNGNSYISQLTADVQSWLNLRLHLSLERD
ncbi:MAG: hypothetical protein Q8M16_06280 [Pirellulaceae bacterium]|nr:hypothetical protein [Pirellulaceae bacterium]